MKTTYYSLLWEGIDPSRVRALLLVSIRKQSRRVGYKPYRECPGRTYAQMARTSRPDIGNLDRLRQTVARHFDQSPLAAIGDQIAAQLAQFDNLAKWDGLDDQSQQEFFRQCNNLLHVIPATEHISRRFWFDIYMIRAAFNGEGEQRSTLPGAILPRAASEWQYVGVHLPNFTPKRMPRIDIIDFPGSDNPDGINLLTYPWLYHELGHLLLGQRGREFGAAVARIVDDISQQRERVRLGKAPAVQERLRQLQERFSRAWRPSANHTDWSHEIATDVVALWSCGPAFLAAYDDSLDGQQAHIIDDVHPPYEIRTAAVIEAAKRLGWSNHTASLASRLDDWTQDSSGARNDVFLALASDELMNGVLTAALGGCNSLGLPRCDSEAVVEVSELLVRGETPAFGRPIILASWLKYEQFQGDVTHYHEWERANIDALIRQVNPSVQ